MKEKDNRRPFTFYIDEDLWREFVRIARENDRTAASQIRVILSEFVTNHENA